MSTEELVQSLETMDPTELAMGVGFVGILLLLTLIGGIVWFFVSAFGYRKMFQKAGEAGWKAFIPYYKNFICFKMAWTTKLFWPWLIALLALQMLPETESLIVTLLNIAFLVVCTTLGIKLDVRLAKSFGKTKIWGVLLFFFPFIVSLILGYGKAEYVGKDDSITEAAEVTEA